MLKRLLLCSTFVLAICWFSATAQGTAIPIGFISWDVNLPGSIGEFDIVNETGPNGSIFPETTFPVTTAVHLSSVSLLVNFSNSTSATFGPLYFTLDADGLSFRGAPIPIGGTDPVPVSATLTGTLSPVSVSLNTGGEASLNSVFTATISPELGKAMIDATTSNTDPPSTDPDPPSMPEPGTWTLTAIGIGCVAFGKRLRV